MVAEIAEPCVAEWIADSGAGHRLVPRSKVPLDSIYQVSKKAIISAASRPVEIYDSVLIYVHGLDIHVEVLVLQYGKSAASSLGRLVKRVSTSIGKTKSIYLPCALPTAAVFFFASKGECPW